VPGGGMASRCEAPVMGRRGATLAAGGRRPVGAHQGSRGTWCNDRDVGSSRGRRAIGAPVAAHTAAARAASLNDAVRLAVSYLRVV
jgi:hypothetical protein